MASNNKNEKAKGELLTIALTKYIVPVASPERN